MREKKRFKFTKQDYYVCLFCFCLLLFFIFWFVCCFLLLSFIILAFYLLCLLLFLADHSLLSFLLFAVC